ncbi:MAG: hypothetical protein ABIV51_03205 [Saprospiraceae bacterium]
MQTEEILKEVSNLSNAGKIHLIEEIIKSISESDEASNMEQAAELLYSDYVNDNDLTAFTALDCEDFYETK